MASPRQRSGWGLVARVSSAVALALSCPPYTFTDAFRGEGAAMAAERLQPLRTLVKTLALAKSHLADPNLVDWPSHIKAPLAKPVEAPSNTLGLIGPRHEVKAQGRDWLDILDPNAFSLVTEGAFFNLFEGPSVSFSGKKAFVKRISMQAEEDVDVVKREIEISKAFSGQEGFVLIYSATAPEHVVVHKDAFIEMEKPIATINDISSHGMHRNVDLHVKLRLFAQVAHAVKTMLDVGVVHRDLSSNNVLILGNEDNPETWRAVVSDFESACTEPDGRWPSLDLEISGTQEFKAPESFVAGYANPQADIYSLGIILFHMLAGRLPHSWYQSREEILTRGYFDVNQDLMFEWFEDKMPVLARLLRRLVARSPSDRATIEDVCSGIKEYAKWQNMTL